MYVTPLVNAIKEGGFNQPIKETLFQSVKNSRRLLLWQKPATPASWTVPMFLWNIGVFED
jgi:hypothetical protein